MTWLVTGGAGYIGAHVVRAFQDAGLSVVVLDDLSTGQRSRVSPELPFVVGSVLDASLLATTLRMNSIAGVVHMAGKKQVAESVHSPLYYYRENVDGLRVLLEECNDAGVDNFVFSSSAAVYGEVNVQRVDEGTTCRPESPYGRTKLIGEWMVRDVAAATTLRYVNLRYFNVAGAASPALGDKSANNLVPMVLERLKAGLPPAIFGTDYPTPDGTCIRDYIHVVDVARAHVTAARSLESAAVTHLTANVGTGKGVSVAEMIGAILAESGNADDPQLTPVASPRRPGDPPCVVASVDFIEAQLGWHAQYDLHEMVRSAWEAFCVMNE